MCYPEEIAPKIFDYYSVNCENLHKMDAERLDRLTSALSRAKGDKLKTVIKMIALVRSATDRKENTIPVVERIKDLVKNNPGNEMSVADCARRIGISLYYMVHIFKKTTGITILEYKKEVKLTKAKDMLLHTEKSIAVIAQECGLGSSSYFSKLFAQSEGVSPSEYRKLLMKRSAPACNEEKALRA